MMNHCRNCNSDYATPGTCNCFAPGALRAAPPPQNVPWAAPWTPYQPTLTPGLPWVAPVSPGIWYTVSCVTATPASGMTMTTVSAAKMDELRANGLITHTA